MVTDETPGVVLLTSHLIFILHCPGDIATSVGENKKVRITLPFE